MSELAMDRTLPPKPTPPTSIAIPGMTWSFDLPDRLKLVIADAITIFSRVDHAVIECIGVLEQADLNRKKQISKEHAHENIRRSVVEEHMKLDIPETWDAFAELRQRKECWLLPVPPPAPLLNDLYPMLQGSVAS